MRKGIFQLLLIMVVVLLETGLAHGQRFRTYWQTPMGNWSDLINWDNGEPTGGGYARIFTGGTAQITEPGEWVRELYVSSDSRVEMSSGTFDAGDREYIGYQTTGTLTQTGGIHTIHSVLFLGYDPGGHGIYELDGGSLMGNREWIGFNYGTGDMSQTGGTHIVSDELVVGFHVDGAGTYQLSGTGLLVAENEYIGKWGVGVFEQSGFPGWSQHTVTSDLYLSYYAGASGSYRLNDGTLSGNCEYIGYSGTDATFAQTGGIHTVSDALYIGYNSTGAGTYELGETGNLSALQEYVGYDGTGTFTQSGGINSVGFLSINATSNYVYSGGTLQINDGLDFKGNLDLDNRSVTVSCVNAIVDLSSGNVLNAAAATLDVGPNSLTIYVPGAHPGTLFGTFQTQGMLHETGTPLMVGSSEGFAGAGNIIDRVDCAGVITAASGQFITLNDGISLRAGGSVSLGLGTLTEDSGTSRIMGGQLFTPTAFIGYSATGTLNQSDGTNITNVLYLGYDTGSQGTYDLGGGDLVAQFEYIGENGTGAFIQSGGTNTISGDLYLASSPSSSGTYDLNGGMLSADKEYIGNGTFSHNDGINTTDWLYVGNSIYHEGTYVLSGGDLSIGKREIVGYSGPGTFTHTAGTNLNSEIFYMAFSDNADGIYTLAGTGEFSTGTAYIGYRSTGTFTQSAGTSTFDDTLYLGYWSGSDGTYAISGGSLSVGDLFVGCEGSGTFSIDNAAANIIVSKKLTFGPDSAFNAVAQATIRMIGSNFENESTDSAAVSGLEDLELIFEGGNNVDLFEVASEDRGAIEPGGWENNFALHALTLGGNDTAKLRLVDIFDNQLGSAGAEALYVTILKIDAGSYLNLNGLNLYYRQGLIDPGAVIDYNGGALIPVPEPVTLSLLFVAALTLLHRPLFSRNRRRKRCAEPF